MNINIVYYAGSVNDYINTDKLNCNRKLMEDVYTELASSEKIKSLNLSKPLLQLKSFILFT